MTSSGSDTDTATDEPVDQDTDTVPVDESEPAFGFDSNMQENIYVREDSWRDLQDALSFETKRVLAQYGLRDDDLFKREIHDAMIRVAANHPEEIAHLIIRDRNVATDAELGEPDSQ